MSDEIDVTRELEARGTMNPDGAVRRRSPGMRAFILTGLAIGIVAGGGMTWWTYQKTHRPAAPVRPVEVKNTLPPIKPFVPPAPEPVAAAPAPASAPQAAFEVPPLPAATTMPPQGAPSYAGQQAAPQKSRAQLTRERRMAGGFSGSEAGAAAPAKVAAQQRHGNNPIENRLQPMQLQPSMARMMGDPNMLLTRGAMIDCGQQSMLITDQPGMVTCYTTAPTYSANGHVVLIDAGTKVVGSYQTGIAQGQKRVFVAWQRIETPQGVLLDIDSPGTDALGAAGETGQIDTHFWERFGGAIMLSLIGDIGSSVLRRAQGSNNQIVSLDNTSQSTDQASAEALRNSVNIPPTLYKNQGERVNIFVARDLDFSSVYSLRPTGAP